MKYKSALLIATATMAIGCSSNARKVQLQNQASLGAESHGMWTRPTEIGYEFGGEISATATSMKTLGFNTGESKPAGGLKLGIITGGISGGGSSLTPTGQFAAYKAVAEAGADGIYVTRVESERSGFPLLMRTEKVTVYGRALTLKDFGPLEESRADRWRYRDYYGSARPAASSDSGFKLPFRSQKSTSSQPQPPADSDTPWNDDPMPE